MTRDELKKIREEARLNRERVTAQRKEALRIKREKNSRLFHRNVAEAEASFTPIQRGRIQKGYNLAPQMDQLLSWLKTVEVSYKWAGAAYFPDQAEAREETAKNTARDIRKAIESTQSIVDQIPERYWTEKKYTDLEHYTVITHKAEKPAWKGPLYYRLNKAMGQLETKLQDLVYMDYENGYSEAANTTADWTELYNKIMEIIRNYQNEMKQAYYSPAQLEKKQQQKKFRVTIGQQTPQKTGINTNVFKNAQNNTGDDSDGLQFLNDLQFT